MREGHSGTVLILPIIHQPAWKIAKIRRRRGVEDRNVSGAAADEQAKTGGECSTNKGNCLGDVEVRKQAEEENFDEDKDQKAVKQRIRSRSSWGKVKDKSIGVSDHESFTIDYLEYIFITPAFILYNTLVISLTCNELPNRKAFDQRDESAQVSAQSQCLRNQCELAIWTFNWANAGLSTWCVLVPVFIAPSQPR